MRSASGQLQPDIRELILCHDPRFVCETYIFEPAPDEEKLGYLFGVGEIEERDGVGRELLELVMSAIQHEYYRDSARPASNSFELALHQANLILHDTAEQGVRDWMGHFDVAIGVLAGSKLHLSAAGEATVILTRKSRLTEVSTGLSHSPITNPLRTFSQVASGDLRSRDVLFFGTGNFSQLFRNEDITRFAIEHSATTISTRLQQLYTDQGSRAPVAALIISILPQYVVTPPTVPAGLSDHRRQPVAVPREALRPRRPLELRRSWLRSILLLAGRLLSSGWRTFLRSVWPHIKRGSRSGGRALAVATRTYGARLRSLTAWQVQRLRQRQPGQVIAYHGGQDQPAAPSAALGFSPPRLRLARAATWPKHIGAAVRRWLSNLPRSSRIFAAVSLLLLIVLVISLVLLQSKRAEDEQIQRASEILHEAQTKKDAAETAMIYDNRDQARSLIAQARSLADQLHATGLYTDELAQLQAEIQQQQDRLLKVVRTSAQSLQTVGDFGSAISQGQPTSLFFVNDRLYTFNPSNNAVVSMDGDGGVNVASQNNQGIGFFTSGIAHAADKIIVLASDEPGLAIFDTKDQSVQKQDITLPDDQSAIDSVAIFGNRLYLYDAKTRNIYVYNKSLRGYSDGTAWITDQDFPKETIQDIAVDGNIFTLHSDGSIKRLFKGQEAEFVAEPVEPTLQSASRLITTDTMANLYVLDTTERRVVIYNKEGQLVRQIFLDTAANLRDIAVGPREETLYVLNGTQVLSMSLTE